MNNITRVGALLVLVVSMLFSGTALANNSSTTDLKESHRNTVWDEFNEEDDCGGLDSEVVWHFILTSPDEGNYTLTAEFDSAGTLSDEGTRSGNGAVHYFIGTGQDTLLDASSTVGGNNLVLSHVCYNETDPDPEPTPEPTETPEPEPTPSVTPTPEPTPTDSPSPVVTPEPVEDFEPDYVPPKANIEGECGVVEVTVNGGSEEEFVQLQGPDGLDVWGGLITIGIHETKTFTQEVEQEGTYTVYTSGTGNHVESIRHASVEVECDEPVAQEPGDGGETPSEPVVEELPNTGPAQATALGIAAMLMLGLGSAMLRRFKPRTD